MQKLDPELICDECGTAHNCLPYEDGDEAPVHCPECGAFLCTWNWMVENHTGSKMENMD